MIDVKELKNLAKGFRVLYVEDEPEVRESIQRYLNKLFSVVDLAENGEQGLSLIRSRDYNIVITDILMPKMNGLEMAAAIKQFKPEQEIIIVSAYSDSQYILEAIASGVNGYILKPVNYEQMNETLFKSVQKLSRFRENFLYKEHLEELVEQRSKALVSAEREKTENFEQTLLALVELIEDRDTYTGGHSERVADYSRMIAKELGFSDKECELIYRAGILHDIGKVATPDSVLLKPGRLSELEYRLIQEHVTVGYDLLSKIPMYKDLSEIMRYHHERYDGGGYPRGLKGDEIPPLARVMIVADAFDAMTTNRIYKARKTIKDAIEELKKFSGIQFDPQVAQAAVQVFSKLKTIDTSSQLPITELEEERFSYYYRDQLTQAYNRDYLDYMLNRNRDEPVFGELYVLYLHNFNQFNNKHGWSNGDRLLAELASTLNEVFKETLLFRLHGDDFVLLSREGLKIDLQHLNQMRLLNENSLELSMQKIDIQNLQVSDITSLERHLQEH